MLAIGSSLALFLVIGLRARRAGIATLLLMAAVAASAIVLIYK